MIFHYCGLHVDDSTSVGLIVGAAAFGVALVVGAMALVRQGGGASAHVQQAALRFMIGS